MAVIKTKVPQFNGFRANVMFRNGVGETDDPKLIEWFKNHGYVVLDDFKPTKSAEQVAKKPETELQLDIIEQETDAVDFEKWSIEELKTYAKSIGRGKGVGVLKTKEQLIRHITKE